MCFFSYFSNFSQKNGFFPLFRRTIFSIEIEEIKTIDEDFDARMKMYCFLIKGNSFLWHQVFLI